MKQEVINILSYNSEGPTLDFKKEDYRLGKHYKKNDILKDLMALANHPSNEDKYIFVGVKASKGMASEFFHINNPLDDANYQEYIKENIEPELQFEYRNFEYDGKLIGYLKIFENGARPYLFKKHVKKPGTNEIEYRRGDGFIRVGSSTNKITRKDLEIIYDNRFKPKDRKNDLKINPVVGIPDDRDLYELGFRYIDIEILNTSNKSIEYEVDLEVFRSDDHVLITEKEVRQILHENHQNTHSVLGASGTFVSFSDPFFSSKDTGNSIILSDMRASKYRLAQKDSSIDIFNQNLLLKVKRMNPVQGIITIRSDDFITGLLKMDLTFEIPNIT